MANLILKRPKTHLVIPDGHAHPDHHNKRFSWLGELIADIKPDVVIDIGDMADMPSLCSYDKGTKGFEGRRYKKDIAAVHDAQERINAPIRRAKKKVPRKVRTLGNHEHRINRAVESDAVLEGVISTDDIGSKEYGWEEYKFLDVATIDNINYSHYFTSGVMGRPVASAKAAVMTQGGTCVMGHQHIFDYYCAGTVNGRHRHGLICGVFQDFEAGFAGPANRMWRRGVAILHNVEDGDFDLQWVSMDQLKREYGR